jgi:hypothetical protein
VDKEEMLRVRVTKDLLAMVEGAAKRSGLHLAEWVRAVLARAANEGAFAPRGGHDAGRRKSR